MCQLFLYQPITGKEFNDEGTITNEKTYSMGDSYLLDEFRLCRRYLEYADGPTRIQTITPKMAGNSHKLSVNAREGLSVFKSTVGAPYLVVVA